MRWTPGDRSNIEDRRGMSGVGVGGLGIGGLLVLLLLSWFTGVDLISLLSGVGGPAPTESVGTTGTGKIATTPEEERMVDMVDAVMDDAQETWEQILGGRYQRTTPSSSVTPCSRRAASRRRRPARSTARPIARSTWTWDSSANCTGSSAHPATSLRPTSWRTSWVTTCRRSWASNRRSAASRPPMPRRATNCQCGWSCRRTASRVSGALTPTRRPAACDLDPGDVDEGLRAAAAIGDDRLQRMQGGRVAPERFTHGNVRTASPVAPPRSRIRRSEQLRYFQSLVVSC